MYRRIVVLAVVALAATTSLMPYARQPVGAQQGGLSLAVTPTSGLTHGADVDVEIGGLPADVGTEVEVWQCDDPVASGVTDEELSRCNFLARSPTGGEPTFTATLGVYEWYVANSTLPEEEILNCSDQPFDCAVVAFVSPPDGEPAGEVATVPVDFVPTPLQVHGRLDDTQPVPVVLALDPGATVTLAQCVDFPEVPSGPAGCVAGPTVTLPDGRERVEMALAATVAIGGVTYACSQRPCEVVAFDPGGNELAAAGIPGSPGRGRITLERSTSLPRAGAVHATVEAGGILYIGQCVAPVLTGGVSVGDGCALLTTVSAGISEHDLPLNDQFTSYLGNDTWVCSDEPGGCIVAMGDGSGATAWYVPITFGPPVSLTLTPSAGLVDGQVMAVDAVGLFPGRAYLLRRCTAPAAAGNCDPGTEVVASEEGELTATVPAAQRLDAPRRAYCRANCVVAITPAPAGPVTAAAPWTMAAGSLAAAPSTGLTDGQAVTVSGTGIMASYDGPLFWIVATGRWMLAECDAALLGQRTLLGVFTHCTTEVGGPVTVAGSTFDQPVQVAAAVDRILGGTTDCTASPGACLAVLVRLEFDGSLSLHTTPLTFA